MTAANNATGIGVRAQLHQKATSQAILGHDDIVCLLWSFGQSLKLFMLPLCSRKCSPGPGLYKCTANLGKWGRGGCTFSCTDARRW